ncbi:unnamed protein product [Ceutorhynchus assimilis]|uniref:DUF7869 domain-containing protein n=1 Tax=Ceutorhynchus assimilis TaxID=467358 RepID=A0A9N9MVV3_9CUCU|nr:unnamed protein product [Ceutorhynchus assimilis]
MQGSRGKRILELVKNAKSEENLEKNRGNYPKIVVHSNIALKGQETIKPIASTSHLNKASEAPAPAAITCDSIPSTSKLNLPDRHTRWHAIEDSMSDKSEEDAVDPYEGSDSRDKDYNPKDDLDTDNDAEELSEDELTAKAPQNVECTQCRFKCSDNFSEEERVQLCSSYWQLEVYSRKKDFILQNVKANVPQRQRHRNDNAKSRTNAKEFHFLKNGIATRVCQKFFLKTLSISNGPLNKAFQKKNDTTGLYNGDDKRGLHIPSNKTTPEDKQIIKNHIESFPLTESHYCRKSSERKYLDATLSIAKMYSLYKELCEKEGYIPKSITTYKRTFCQEYNFSFFKPRKDQCAVCMKYQDANADQKAALEISFNEHKQRELDANESKKFDKERAIKEANFVTATFDLQSVLQIPSSDVSPMYYSRKICAYNLTIYEGAPPNNAFCFTWTEVNGARGSLEIATCLFQYLRNLPNHVTDVSFFSDTCGGQNRNQNVLAMLYYFVHYGGNQIATIEQKFLESGHSMMECDSMHSAIEKQKRYLAVYTLNDWINIFKMARSKRGKKKNDPYIVTELKYSDFIDLKAISLTLLKNKTVNTQGEKVKWLQIKCFRIEKDCPRIIKYRYSHKGDYLSLNIGGRGRPSATATTSLPNVRNAYSSMLPISVQKYQDLKKLCNSGVIPIEFHHWYLSLPTSKAVINKNPEPSVESESEIDLSVILNKVSFNLPVEVVLT